jgi:hypothetical protein
VKIFTHARRDFTARYLSDMSKAIFAVALASRFFGDLPFWARVFLILAGCVLFSWAFIIVPKGGQHD